MDAKRDLKAKLPSRHVTEGPERAPHRSYYYAMGLTREQIHQPFVGVATCWNEAAPCNIALMRQAQAVKKGVAAAKVDVLLKDANADTRARLERHRNAIMTLARLNALGLADSLPGSSAQFVLDEATAALPLGDVIDFAKERQRLERDLKKTETEIARFDAKLKNADFVARAPQDVIDEQKEKRAEAEATMQRLREAVVRLG